MLKINFENPTQSDLDLILENIGNQHPEIRDEYLFNSFAQNAQNFNETQLNWLFKQLISNLESTDRLVKSFSALFLVRIINLQPKLISSKLIDAIFDAFIKETDVTGFDREVGWVHLFAHFSDLIFTIIYLGDKTNFSEEQIQTILIKVFNLEEELQNHTEGRIANVFAMAIDKQIIKFNDLLNWLEELSSKEYPQYLTTIDFTLKLLAILDFENLISSIQKQQLWDLIKNLYQEKGYL
ncbi:MAG: DUF2785 domain-containing protein [Lactobacillaceae bacterium]|jgi:hypothetical protein|nr:DUF2785 domain-containing protein [Lactobacillaceae bacterium]